MPRCDPYPAPHPHPYHWQGPCLLLPVLQASAAAWASGEGDQPQWEQMAVSLPCQRVYHHSNTDLSMLALGQQKTVLWLACRIVGTLSMSKRGPAKHFTCDRSEAC